MNITLSINSLASCLLQYDRHEARSIIRLLLSDTFGLTLTDICSGALTSLDERQINILEQSIERLKNGEPIQYVTGKACFYNRIFNVRKGCLIPRPETESLCRWIIENSTPHARILDIGTGSGCIAITLKKEMPSTTITSWDISVEALDIARENAAKNNADIEIVHQDALNPPSDKKRWDIIVSNPPYICAKEAKEMEPHVLNYEPKQALFVPDDDPLMFYKSIAKYAKTALKTYGILFFEINPLYTKEIMSMLENYGLKNIISKNDEYGKTRMIKAQIL